MSAPQAKDLIALIHEGSTLTCVGWIWRRKRNRNRDRDRNRNLNHNPTRDSNLLPTRILTLTPFLRLSHFPSLFSSPFSLLR
jgi:hypothetical protein